MEISLDEVRRLARLAGLRIPEGELAEAAAQLAAMARLAQGLPKPAAGMDGSDEAAVPETGPTMALREDVVRPSLPREAILQNAPKTADGCFVVPKTVD